MHPYCAWLSPSLFWSSLTGSQLIHIYCLSFKNALASSASNLARADLDSASTFSHQSKKLISCLAHRIQVSLEVLSGNVTRRRVERESGWMRPQISSVNQASNCSGIGLTWRRSREAHSPEDGERWQLLKVKREVQTETGLKESSDGLWGNRALFSLCLDSIIRHLQRHYTDL